MKFDQKEKLHPLEIALRETREYDRAEKTNVITPHSTDFVQQEEIPNDQPWHRQFAHKLLEGGSILSCSLLFDKTPAQLVAIKSQNWFRLLIVELSSQFYKNDVTGLLEGAAADAVITLSELAVSGKTESIRQRAASDILDKYLKNRIPPQPKKEEDPQKALEAINKELKQYESD